MSAHGNPRYDNAGNVTTREGYEAVRLNIADAVWPRDVPMAYVELGALAAAELVKASSKFPPMNGPHEGWAVIREELDELWDHVRADTGSGDAARKEAIQIAAMALRYVADVCDRVHPTDSGEARKRGMRTSADACQGRTPAGSPMHDNLGAQTTGDADLAALHEAVAQAVAQTECGGVLAEDCNEKAGVPCDCRETAAAVLRVTMAHEQAAIQADRDRINRALDQTYHRFREHWDSSGGRFCEPVPTFDCAEVRRVIADV